MTIPENFPKNTERVIEANRLDIVIKGHKNKKVSLLTGKFLQTEIFVSKNLISYPRIKTFKLR